MGQELQLKTLLVLMSKGDLNSGPLQAIASFFPKNCCCF